MKSANLLACSAILLLVSSVLAAAQQFVPSTSAQSSADVAENTWVSKAPMHQARSGLGVAVVNGKIYAIGGDARSGKWPYVGSIVDTNEEYDPATDTWTFKTPMPTPRCDFAIATYQNKIYCIGGYNNGTVTGVNEVYDPATDTWKTKAPMPTSRDYFATAVYQNKIYCIGGVTGYSSSTGEYFYTGVNEVYDPATNKWEIKAPMPKAKVAEANVVNGKIYMIGGNPDNTLNQVYDPATDSWTNKAPIPTEAHGASAVINNKIYFISYFYSGGQFNVLNQIYDPETDKWAQGATPPTGGVKRGALILTTGEMAPKRIYILDDALRVYDPETDTWTFGAKMPTARINFAVAVVNDMLYAIGGNTYTYPDPLHSIGEDPIITPYATNEQYTPIGYGTVSPVVSVVSPENNRTYAVSNVSLTFTVNKPVVWMGYSLDGQDNVTVTGNTTLSGLSSGLHNVTVYAKDSFGNTGASETITFTIAKPEPLPTTIAAAVASVAVVGVGLIAYFKKRNNLSKKQRTPIQSVQSLA
jgi:N-acetylneuraminic acid mutarotase